MSTHHYYRDQLTIFIVGKDNREKLYLMYFTTYLKFLTNI